MFVVTVDYPGTPQALWQRLWDLDRHTDATPLTRVRRITDEPLGRGSTFVAVTSVGRWRFEDRMQITEWDPCRHAVIEKLGPRLGGRIDVSITQDAVGSRVTWRQEFRVKGVPSRLAALARTPVSAGYRHALRSIVA